MAEVTERKKRIDRGVKVRSETIYAVSSLKELSYLYAPRLALILGLLILPVIVPGLYWQRVLCLTGIYALLAISFDFLANFVGLICLGTAFFVGTGGYASGMLNAAFDWPMFVTIPLGTVIGAIICTLALMPCLRLRGIYFAIVSFIYPLITAKLITATGVFGGTDGIAGLSILPNIWANQYIILGITLIGAFGLRRLVNEDIGVVFRGIKDNDQAIKASGINITLYKASALFIASLIGCFAGAYLSHLYGWVGISLFALDFSVFPLAAVVVGGAGTIAGPLIGTLSLVPISETLRSLGGFRIIFYSMLIVIFVMFFREGILNWARRKYEQFELVVRI